MHPSKTTQSVSDARIKVHYLYVSMSMHYVAVEVPCADAVTAVAAVAAAAAGAASASLAVTSYAS